MQFLIELFSDIHNKQNGQLTEGRNHFLRNHNLSIDEPQQLTHAVSYISKTENSQEEIIEIYPDQIWRAAAHNFPTDAEEAFIQMLTEEILAEFYMTQWKPVFHGDPWTSDMLWFSVIDELIEEVMEGKSYSKIVRSKSAHRLMRRLARNSIPH